MAIELTEKEQKAREMVCLPLDRIADLHDLKVRVEELSPVVGLFKLGKGTFTRLGRDAIQLVQNHRANVFLDLKYHDIPATLKDAASAAAESGVYMFNVHAAGGYEMMQAAREGAENGADKAGVAEPKIAAVTVLTSLDLARFIHNELYLIRGLAHMGSENYQAMVTALEAFPFTDLIDLEVGNRKGDLDESDQQRLERLTNSFEGMAVNYGLKELIPLAVEHYAHMANQARLDGIVCSAADLYAVRDKLPEDFMYVTPGIKGPRTAAGEDQKRVFTPGNAVQNGSSILVVGRAITGPKTSEERVQAGYEVLQDMAKYL